jgi:3-phosphoshikimate 1-carboxyvinyltransferase
MDSIQIQPSGPIHAEVQPPGSKSLTNRALACAALASGTSTLVGVLDSEDTRVMVESLKRLGISVETDWQSLTHKVQGCAGKIPAAAAELFVENSGTTIRFMTALCALAHGRFRLDGIQRMRQRPIGDLLASLQQLGVNAFSENGDDCPPIRMIANGIKGGKTQIRGDVSSQFLSGLLMAAPYATEQIAIVVDGALVSKPYVAMTLKVMKSFGCEVTTDESLSRFWIPNRKAYRGIRYQIEPDASAASYFWGAAAITGGNVLVKNLHRDALQGDVAFCDRLREMGCQIWETPAGIAVQSDQLQGIETDMNEISDTVQTLAAVALFAKGPTTIRGVAHNRHKETDRISDLACELRKVGAEVEEFPDGLRITPGELRPATIDTYNDHRMAMSMALVGLKQPGIVINDPGCTRKTFPDYFQQLSRISEPVK